jgi:hypothetical protein
MTQLRKAVLTGCLPFPCKLAPAGWVNAATGSPLTVRPTFLETVCGNPSAPPGRAKEDQAAWVTGREVSEEEKQEMRRRPPARRPIRVCPSHRSI